MSKKKTPKEKEKTPEIDPLAKEFNDSTACRTEKNLLQFHFDRLKN
jgi:hypothetical protein